MIKQVQLVRNVGILTHLAPNRGIQFSKLTICYAGNGYGKTTLAAILRSLKTGEAVYIAERKTLGSSEPQQVVLVSDQGNHVFGNGSWNTTFGGIEVFDSAFISSNVYEGRSVDHDHKRNLCRFVLGSEGVRLVLEVDRLDEEIRELNNQIAEIEKRILRVLVGSLDVDDFVALQLSSSIDDDILIKEGQIASLKKAAEIAQRECLVEISARQFPIDRLRELLSKTLDHVKQDAERRMREHIERCLDEHGERWLEQGMQYAKSGLCPFCSASLEGNDLFQAYESFFDEAYKALKDSIRSFDEQMRAISWNTVLNELQGSVAKNNSRSEFWRTEISADFPFLRVEDIGNAWQALAQALLNDLNMKAKSPLETVLLSQESKKALATYDAILEDIDEYNLKVKAVNDTINKKKESVASASLGNAQAELQILQNRKKRGEPGVRKLCSDYSDLLKTRKSKTREKDQAKKNLTDQTARMLTDYQEDINKHLQNCGATFRIADTKPSYAGGRSSTNYCLEIKSCKVELAKSEENPEAPWFGNTLSDGDKSTLAFAFFLAKLERDPNLADKVVVFDDPLTSLDRTRRSYSIEQMLRIVEAAKQVFVLTHDAYLARSLWKDPRGNDALTLELDTTPNRCSLGECDIDKITESGYFRDYRLIREYLYDGSDAEPEDVLRRIRPLVEGNLRLRFPGAFRSSATLGSMIKRIREADSTDNISKAQSRLTDLEDFNRHGSPEHHSEPDTPAGPIDIGELRTYAQRALDFVTG